MTEILGTEPPRVYICCDWGKEFDKRAVFLTDTRTRRIRFAGRSPFLSAAGTPWSVREALACAREFAPKSSVVLAFDVPLGVPLSYFHAAKRYAPWTSIKTFVDWLPLACRHRGFLESSNTASTWRVDRPFFAVPAGKGSLKAFEAEATRYGVLLLRSIERQACAKPVFVTSGIPGSVGSAAIEFWRELVDVLAGSRDFALWPFEGKLDTLLNAHRIVLAEMYPRAAYSVALSSSPPEERARLKIAKNDEGCRRAALRELLDSKWVRDEQVVLTPEDVESAAVSEDSFDALITAAALLRCALDGTPLSQPALEDPEAEGGILCTGGINLALPERNFAGPCVESPSSRMCYRAGLLMGM
ncbi:hypothetical protein JQX13_34295 [Archangium violaceum]|uniref:hypothetical protein n=1 Tax=Archangium violaceum TaxID=83451 RepID=UPI00193C5464|nr:hypothetical protein [Archangium violaceum]QRK05242.1 hypothetical protein JQX13_34295 [Archangium violaceum]